MVRLLGLAKRGPSLPRCLICPQGWADQTSHGVTLGERP